ncbi:MAG: DUF4854 domain-containing protein [Lachnospiraceae bacterium]|nr:DUF4854 domain-containing protein [Lachnospiraceae bacterium]
MKNRKRFFANFAGICLAVSMTVSFAGCGSKEEEDVSGSFADSGTPSPTEGKLISSNNKRFSTVQEYLDAQKTQIDAMLKQYKDSGMTMEVKADGDTLVYRYIYDEPVDVTQGMFDYFDSSIDGFRAQFDTVIDEIGRLVDVAEPAVQLLYENPDGSLIYSCVLTKDEVTPTYGELSEGSVLNNGEKFANVAEYVDAQKDQIDALLKQIEGSGMTMQIYGEGNTLVYRYIYDEAVEVSQENAALIESSLESSRAQFEMVITEMESLIDATDLSVKVQYENPDGTIVYSATFTK